jgi:hypothetical protein
MFMKIMRDLVAREMFDADFWFDAEGNNPKVGTKITLHDIKSGKFRPSDSGVDLESVKRFLKLVPVEIWAQKTDT